MLSLCVSYDLFSYANTDENGKEEF